MADTNSILQLLASSLASQKTVPLNLPDSQVQDLQNQQTGLATQLAQPAQISPTQGIISALAGAIPLAAGALTGGALGAGYGGQAGAQATQNVEGAYQQQADATKTPGLLQFLANQNKLSGAGEFKAQEALKQEQYANMRQLIGIKDIDAVARQNSKIADTTIPETSAASPGIAGQLSTTAGGVPLDTGKIQIPTDPDDLAKLKTDSGLSPDATDDQLKQQLAARLQQAGTGGGQQGFKSKAAEAKAKAARSQPFNGTSSTESDGTLLDKQQLKNADTNVQKIEGDGPILLNLMKKMKGIVAANGGTVPATGDDASAYNAAYSEATSAARRLDTVGRPTDKLLAMEQQQIGTKSNDSLEDMLLNLKNEAVGRNAGPALDNGLNQFALRISSYLHSNGAQPNLSKGAFSSHADVLAPANAALGFSSAATPSPSTTPAAIQAKIDDILKNVSSTK